jgi:hypothetical protein
VLQQEGRANYHARPAFVAHVRETTMRNQKRKPSTLARVAAIGSLAFNVTIVTLFFLIAWGVP